MPVNTNKNTKPAAPAKVAAPAKATASAKATAQAKTTAQAKPVNDLKKAADQAASAVKNVVKAASDPADLLKEAGNTVVNKNTRAELFKKICGLIPNQVNNQTVVNAFELMRKEQKLLKKDFSGHMKKNETAFKAHEAVIKKNKGFVEDQNAYTDMAYGESTMQYSGCEIFATFNAMFAITGKHEQSLSQLIAEYEKDGMVFSGKFGTAPKAISELLTKNGFKTEMTTVEKEFDEIGKKFQSFILTMYNDGEDISQEVHTINISKDKDQYTAHNVYCNGKVVGPYKSISEVIKNINGGKAKGISLIGVKKA